MGYKGLSCAFIGLAMAVMFGFTLSGSFLSQNEWTAVKDMSVTPVEYSDVEKWHVSLEKPFLSESVVKIGEGLLFGPESVVQSAFDEEVFYAGTADGLLIQIRIPCDHFRPRHQSERDIHHESVQDETTQRESVKVETVSDVSGRPLGVLELNENEILVLEAAKGQLLRVSKSDASSVSLVNDNGPGLPLTYPNDMDIDRENGIVYFSDSTNVRPIYDESSGLWSTMRAAQLDILSGTPTGRLFSHSLDTNVTELLVDGIAYANGVALANDRSFVLVCETGRYRVLRHWLTGPLKGTTEVFFDVPGSPDGITASEDGTFWLAVILPRSKPIQWIQQYPWLQHIALRVPSQVWPLPPAQGMAVQLDRNGSVLQVLQDSTGEHVHAVSAVHEASCKDRHFLLLGGLERKHVLVYDLSKDSA